MALGEQDILGGLGDMGSLSGAPQQDLAPQQQGAFSPEEALMAAGPPSQVDMTNAPFMQQVFSKMGQGVFGIPIPQFVIAGAGGAVAGAGIGSAAGPMGTGIGAAAGAIAGVISDFLGSATDVAVQRAMPSTGVPTPFGQLSPEFAGMLAGAGVGILSGGATLKAVEATNAIGGLTKPMLKLMGMDLPEMKQIPLASLLPNDPVAYMRDLDPMMRKAARIASGFGVPDWDQAILGMSPETLGSLQSQFSKIYSPPAGTDYLKDPFSKMVDKVFPVAGYRKGSDIVQDLVVKGPLKMLTVPERIAIGDPMAEKFVQEMKTFEIMEQQMTAHLKRTRLGWFEGISTQDKEWLKTTQAALQGKQFKGKLNAKFPQPTKSGEQYPLWDESPIVTKEMTRTEVNDKMLDLMQRSGKQHLIGPWQKMAGLRGEQFTGMVELRALKPEDDIANYLTRVRQTSEAQGQKIVELPNGYFPISLERSMGKAKGYFLNERRMDVPPKDLSYDQLNDIYDRTFSHIVAHEAQVPKLKALIEQIQDPKVASYMGATFNYLVGARTGGPEHIGQEIAGLIKNVEFMRTIGGSLLSPLMNAMQSMNMLGQVGIKNWMKGFLPNKALDAKLVGTGYAGKDILRTSAALDEESGIYGLLRGGLSKIGNVLGRPFAWSENMVRKQAFRSSYYNWAEAGMPDDAAMKYALLDMDRTNFVTKVGRTVPIMRGNLGGVLGQFKTYSLNQLFFLDNLVRRNPMGAARFATGALMMLGPDAIIPGGDMWMTRHILGQPMKSPFKGLFGNALGASIAEYSTVTGFNPDDFRRLSQYLPGPAIGHAQDIAKFLTGINYGTGLDLDNFGLPLTPDQRASAFTRAIPFMGSELNRIRGVAKLVQSGNVERAAQDFWQAMGISPSEGPMTRRLDTFEAAGKLFGINSTRIHDQEAFQEEARNVTEQYKRTMGIVGELLATGREDQAEKYIRRFRQKYPEVAYFFPTVQGLKGAQHRLIFPETWREIQHLPLPIRLPYMQQIFARELPSP